MYILKELTRKLGKKKSTSQHTLVKLLDFKGKILSKSADKNRIIYKGKRNWHHVYKKMHKFSSWQC